MSLTFDQLRSANVARIPRFRNKKGQICHNADGSDWTAADWLMAVTGELGELANLLKKIRRGDFTENDPGVVDEVAKELADVQTYLDILAFRCGIDLGDATTRKFNAVSDRVNAAIYIAGDGEIIDTQG